MIRVKKLSYFWLPAIVWMALIYWLSSFHKLQASPVNWQDFIIRKLAHFSEYFILCLLFYRGFKNTTKVPFKKILLLSIFFTFFNSLSDEYHQTFVSGRTGRLFDIGVDTSGGIFGAFFIAKLLPKSSEKVKNFFKKINIF